MQPAALLAPLADLRIRNDATEVVPRSGGRFEVRSLHTGGVVGATAYQLGVLERFGEPTSIDGVMSAFPFEPERTRAFLADAERAGVLLPLDAAGLPLLPDRSEATPSIFGAPSFEAHCAPAIAFLGVPYDGATSGRPGARFGPAAVRGASEGARYQVDPRTLQPCGFRDHARGATLLEGITLADAGDVRVLPGEAPEGLHARIERSVGELLAAGAVPAVIGGDHSITLPALRAAARATEALTIVHLDAHTDLGVPLPGQGLDHGNVFTLALEELPSIQRLVQFGLRGLSEGGVEEEEHADKIRAFGLHQVRALGLQAVLDVIPRDTPCWITVDIDVVDPVYAPSTGTPVPGGAWPHELLAWLAAIARARPVIGFDLVEVAEPQGPADGTAALALEAMITIADGLVRFNQQGDSDEG